MHQPRLEEENLDKKKQSKLPKCDNGAESTLHQTQLRFLVWRKEEKCRRNSSGLEIQQVVHKSFFKGEEIRW